MRTNPFQSAISIFLLLIGIFQSAQAQNQIAGTVHDASGNGLPYASVVLLAAHDSTLVRGLFTSDAGAYQFDNVPVGRFLVCFSMIGFGQVYSEPVAFENTAAQKQLGTVVLKESSTKLGEALIVAKRPFLEQRIDRTVVNVANSITSAGSNALQVLQRSPGVQVNTLTKSISMMGKEGVVIMINGKVSRQPADAIIQMLEGMNSDNIDHIELIHTPPANFEAEGNAGIINIVLKSTGDAGLNGGYSAKGGYGKGGKYGAGMYFNLRKGRFNMFGNYDYNYNLNPQVFTNYRGLHQGSDFVETDTWSDRYYTPTASHNARLGADFQVSPKTVVGVLGTFSDTDWEMKATNETVYSTNGAVQSRLMMPNTETNHGRDFAGNINLAHQITPKQSISLDADVIRHTINNPSNYVNNYEDANGVLTSRNELRIGKSTPIWVGVAKADYEGNFGDNLKVEAGGKYTKVRFDNDVRVDSREPQQDWVAIQDLTSLFHLNESIAGAYTTFSLKADPKTSVKAGLRYEYTQSNLGSAEQPNVVDRHYGSWFPSLFVERKLNETQNLTFSYSRRITRPQITWLAPWLIFLDPSTLQGGNPALQPSFTNALKLEYGIKSWHISASYSVENNSIYWVPMIDPKTNRQISARKNLGDHRVAALNAFVTFHPAKWWDMQNNCYANISTLDFILNDQQLRNANVNYGFNTTQTFKLPRQFTLEISGQYDSPGYWGIAKWKSTGSLNLGLEKNFGEKWGKLRFSANNLFASDNWIGSTYQPAIDLSTRQSFRFAERTFMLSWSNTFGNNKLKSARQRQAGAADELRRI